jgi:hypothetical protein
MSKLLDCLTEMREKGYHRKTFEMDELLAMYGEVRVLEVERERRDNSYFDAGLRTAAIKCVEWADASCGGSGAGGEGYRNLSNVILAMQKCQVR